MLRDDSEARLILYFHGTSGTLASGWRPDSYRALYSGAPHKIHILTFDYRGYGLSTATPTEPGIIQDAVADFKCATAVAGIASERIVIFGQSLGSAAAVALADNLATQTPSVSCAGLVITASFLDVATLTSTYRIGGVIPVLSLVSIPPLSRYFSQDRIRNFIQKADRYHITLIHALIHAEDDPDIPLSHTDALFWHAVNASTSDDLSYDTLAQDKEMTKVQLGEGGWFIEWPTKKGLIRQEVLKYGVHDKIMSYPVLAIAVLRAMRAVDPAFET